MAATASPDPVGPPPPGADDASDPLPARPDGDDHPAPHEVGGPWHRWAALASSRGLDPRAPLWVLAVLVAAAGGWWLLRPAPAPVEETLPLATTASGPGVADTGAAPDDASHPTAAGAPERAATTAASPVVAHAAGAVAAPGVYSLDGGARIDDLVTAAGGLAPDADPSRVNLAAPLADGAWIYVPRVGEEAPSEPARPVPPPGTAGGPSDPSGSDPSPGEGPIDLNAADEAELEELPGVGPAIAAAIVAHREEVGGFGSVEELLDVRGIGEAKLADIRPLVRV